MKMVICDICGEKCKDTSSYILPEYKEVCACKGDITLMKVSYGKIEPVIYDLCDKCEIIIADKLIKK